MIWNGSEAESVYKKTAGISVWTEIMQKYIRGIDYGKCGSAFYGDCSTVYSLV